MAVVGKTKHAGFEVGVRRTLPHTVEEIWDFLFSQEGINLWLGKVDIEKFEVDQHFRTKQGTTGTLTLFKEQSHIRMAWKKKGWTNDSLLQIRVINAKGKATISFHQDKLLNAKQRAEMKTHWTETLENINLRLIG